MKEMIGVINNIDKKSVESKNGSNVDVECDKKLSYEILLRSKYMHM